MTRHFFFMLTVEWEIIFTPHWQLIGDNVDSWQAFFFVTGDLFLLHFDSWLATIILFMLTVYRHYFFLLTFDRQVISFFTVDRWLISYSNRQLRGSPFFASCWHLIGTIILSLLTVDRHYFFLLTVDRRFISSLKSRQATNFFFMLTVERKLIFSSCWQLRGSPFFLTCWQLTGDSFLLLTIDRRLIFSSCWQLSFTPYWQPIGDNVDSW